ncbi:molybdate ABC transporter substrate-binding protein [Bacillus sp. C1-1]|nr:molybdate ABC transporter substrate-binding protein [Bacillus sp. C1-1]
MKKGLLVTAIGIILAGCSSNETEEVMIMAAASLNDAVDELIESYEQNHDVHIKVNYGSSGQLRQQILQGAPADLFLSASIADMEEVVDVEGVESSTTLIENTLVLIAAPEIAPSLTSWADLTTATYQGLAIGETETVPAGRYGKQALESMGIFADIEDKLIVGKDVRQVLTYVQTGNADVGIVYETDARVAGDAVTIVAEAPANSHDSIHYPIGLLTTNDSAAVLYEWLQQDEAIATFESYGFQKGE